MITFNITIAAESAEHAISIARELESAGYGKPNVATVQPVAVASLEQRAREFFKATTGKRFRPTGEEIGGDVIAIIASRLGMEESELVEKLGGADLPSVAGNEPEGNFNDDPNADSNAGEEW